MGTTVVRRSVPGTENRPCTVHHLLSTTPFTAAHPLPFFFAFETSPGTVTRSTDRARLLTPGSLQSDCRAGLKSDLQGPIPGRAGSLHTGEGPWEVREWVGKYALSILFPRECRLEETQ